MTDQPDLYPVPSEWAQRARMNAAGYEAARAAARENPDGFWGEQAVVEMWTRRAEFYLANPIMLSVRHSHPALAALEATQLPQVAEYNRAAAERFMKTLDLHLAEREFMALDRFTIADIVAVVGLDFARIVRYRPPEEFGNLARWLEGCRARSAAKAGA